MHNTENADTLTKWELQKGLGVNQEEKTAGNTMDKKIQNPYTEPEKILSCKASILPME